jgi:hypothetical protein
VADVITTEVIKIFTDVETTNLMKVNVKTIFGLQNCSFFVIILWLEPLLKFFVSSFAVVIDRYSL